MNEQDNSFDYYKTGLGDQSEREIAKRIKLLHDKYRPEAIFMTQTSAVSYGWMIKEIWKIAWPKENIPKILTIDTHPILNHSGEPIESENILARKTYDKFMGRNIDFFENPEMGPYFNGSEFEREEVLKKLRKDGQDAIKELKLRERKENPVYDHDLWGYQIANPSWPEFQKLEKGVEKKISQYKITGNIAIIDEAMGTNTQKSFWDSSEPMFESEQGKLYGTTRNSVKMSPTLGIARQIILTSVKNLGLKSKVATLGLGGDPSCQGHYGPFEKIKEKTPEGKTNYWGIKLKNRKERELTKEAIPYYQEFGREVGKEINRRNQSLERQLLGIFSLAGFIASLFFLSSNITGDVVGDLSLKSSSIIGAGLFIMGLVAGFFCLRKRKT